MTFAVAELHAEGWHMHTEVSFNEFEDAVVVAKRWGAFRRTPVGVAHCELTQLIWRSDGGDLTLPCLGLKPPDSSPPCPA